MSRLVSWAEVEFVSDKEAGMRRTLSSPALLLVALLVTEFPGVVGAQSFVSPQAARELVNALMAAGLDTIAALDPAEPGTFVAALHAGAQLLVVSARHPSDAAVVHRITARQYRDVYLDLQGTPTPQRKFFVQDAGADGISDAKSGGGGVDVLYEDGVTQTLFNGQPKIQNLTSAQYSGKLSGADARYAKLLQLLAEAVRQGSGAVKGPGA